MRPHPEVFERCSPKLRGGVRMGDPANAPRCKAKSKNGEPCGAARVRGNTVCIHHGGVLAKSVPCSGTKLDGAPCGAVSIRGETLCSFHSGRGDVRMFPEEKKKMISEKIRKKAKIKHGWETTEMRELRREVRNLIVANGGKVRGNGKHTGKPYTRPRRAGAK